MKQPILVRVVAVVLTGRKFAAISGITNCLLPKRRQATFTLCMLFWLAIASSAFAQTTLPKWLTEPPQNYQEPLDTVTRVQLSAIPPDYLLPEWKTKDSKKSENAPMLVTARNIGQAIGGGTTWFSDDGTVAVIANSDNLVLIDALSGRELKRTIVPNSAGSYWTAVYLNKYSKMVLAFNGSEILLWDIYKNKTTLLLTGFSRANIKCAGFSRNGKHFVAIDKRHVRVWSIAEEWKEARFSSGLSTCSHVIFDDQYPKAIGAMNDGQHGILAISAEGQNWQLHQVAEPAIDKFLTAEHNVADRYFVKYKDGLVGVLLVSSGETIKKLTLLNCDAKRAWYLSAISKYGVMCHLGDGNSDFRIINDRSGAEEHVFPLGFNPSASVSPAGDRLLYYLNGYSGIHVVNLISLNGIRSKEGVEPITAHTIGFFDSGKAMALMANNFGLTLLNEGNEIQFFTVPPKGRSKFSKISPDGNYIFSDSHKEVQLIHRQSGELLFSISKNNQEKFDFYSSAAFSHDGTKLAFSLPDFSIEIWDIQRKMRIFRLIGHQSTINAIVFNPITQHVVSGDQNGNMIVWKTDTDEKKILSVENVSIHGLYFAPDGNRVLVRITDQRDGAKDQRVLLVDAQSWKVHRELRNREIWKSISGIRSWPFTRDSSHFIVCPNSYETKKGCEVVDSDSGKIVKEFGPAYWTYEGTDALADFRVIVTTAFRESTAWDGKTGKRIATFFANDKPRALAIHPSGDWVVTSYEGGFIKLWRTSDGSELATITYHNDGTWVVTDPEGRFDTADLESMPHLHWVMPDDPFTPVPLEAFIKDYYEPRLLARILAGEKFKPVRPLTSLNRTQPEVQIKSVKPDASDPSLVTVTVSAAGATKSYLQGEKEVPRPTAVHDLRLFRDGQVVAYADGKLADYKGSAFSKTFTVRLPAAKAGQDVVFSAYAFNDDRVKSETVRSTYKAPASIVARKGKAYVISMGVNNHDNAAWNLNFAANDARLVSRTVSEKLTKSTQHQDVVAITLVSDGVDKQASKAAMKAILDRMSGKPLDAAATALLQTIKGADKLQTATPDDLVLLSFSGHGFADDSGNFYLIPQDTGAGTGKNVTAELRQHSISSEELSQWLRDVDAGDMTMIVDACQSAASVQGNDFKPGPMGSRGLGQLAFDKGMRILAASQSDEEALEDGRIQQGLLSYALVRDGLDKQKADYKPADKKITLDEWLNYGVSRVPSLADDVKAGKLTAVRSATPVSADGKSKKVSSQQPSLFDFAKGRRDVVLDAGLK